MDSMEINKGVAAVLVAGIVFFLTGLIGMQLVKEKRPEKPAIAIAGAPAETAAAAAKPEALPPIAPLLAKADVATGESTAKKLCTSCHTFNDGGKAGVGPNLYGVVGGPHAHMQGFDYSAGMKAKTGPWTFDELNEWLHKPSSYVPGTRMAFPGISNDQQRADVIDYLHTLSPNPVPLPSP
jgi:cytochrome c